LIERVLPWVRVLVVMRASRVLAFTVASISSYRMPERLWGLGGLKIGLANITFDGCEPMVFGGLAVSRRSLFEVSIAAARRQAEMAS
jgi:hypothetical protein